MIKLNRHGEPFKTIQAARTGVMHLKNKGFTGEPIEIEGGFGIKVEGEEPVDKPRRPKRIKIGTRNVLTRDKVKGYVLRNVAINPEKEGWDRVRRFIDAGYEMREGDAPIEDSRISAASKMGTADVQSIGGGMKGVWMKIKEEWYEEDKAERLADIDDQENAMMEKINNPGDGMYGNAQIGPSG